jgi:hypothetical protein
MIRSESMAVSPPPPSEARRTQIVELARTQCQEEGGVEIDDNAQISEGGDNGCYVAAWVWLDFTGTPFDKETPTEVGGSAAEPGPGCKDMGSVLCKVGPTGPASELAIKRCDTPGLTDRQEQAVRRFIDCWNLSMPYDEVGPLLNCGECNALHELLQVFGATAAAEALILAHAAGDDEGDDPQHLELKVAQETQT